MTKLILSRLKLFFFTLLSLPFCLRYFPLRIALKIPVLIHPSVRVKIDKTSKIVLPQKIWRSMFSIGFECSEGRSNCRTVLSLRDGSILKIEGLTIMAKGTRLIMRNGQMKIGMHFFCNGDCSFYNTCSIIIGDNNMYGWNISFNTSDGHHIYENGVEKPMEGDITIGNHVWIASHCIIGKNTSIADDCVVAQHSLVGKRFEQSKCLIGGMPAKVIKEEFTWSA